MPSCSVVMPHYENQRTLLACLQSFTRGQTQRPCEVIVVDDGSKESPAALVAGSPFAVPVQLLFTRRAGQSGATNAGLAAAKGDIVLLTCADIIATPTLVAQHLAAHDEAKKAKLQVAVGGYIGYAPWLKMTPFMRFLSGPGPQFGFDNIQDPNDVPPAMLYAPNVSVGRDALLQVGGFDPELPYGFQDTDLGLRLSAVGLRLWYRKAARVLHDHPNNLQNFVRRNQAIGRYIPRMLEKHRNEGLRARARLSVLELSAQLPKLPAILQAADDLEQRAQALPSKRAGTEKYQQVLFATYHKALGLAFVAGLLSAGAAAKRALQLTDAAWQKAQAEAHGKEGQQAC